MCIQDGKEDAGKFYDKFLKGSFGQFQVKEQFSNSPLNPLITDCKVLMVNTTGGDNNPLCP